MLFPLCVFSKNELWHVTSYMDCKVKTVLEYPMMVTREKREHISQKFSVLEIVTTVLCVVSH